MKGNFKFDITDTTLFWAYTNSGLFKCKANENNSNTARILENGLNSV